MSLDAATAILLIPAITAAVLAVMPGYRATARFNMLAALATFLVAASLLFVRPQPGPYLHIDDLNVVFIVLTTFVGFTTSVFSASYIEHEIETGRLTPTFLRSRSFGVAMPALALICTAPLWNARARKTGSAVNGRPFALAQRYVVIAISQTSNSRPRHMRRNAPMIGVTSSNSSVAPSGAMLPSFSAFVWP